MGQRAYDRGSDLIDLTEMSLEDVAGLDAALIDGALTELLSAYGDVNRLWACQLSARDHMWESLPVRA